MLKIDSEYGTVDLSVRDFAGFGWSEVGAQGFKGGVRRMELGREWHATLAQRARAQLAAGAELHIEMPLQVTLVRDHWALRFSGRVDQLLVGGDGTVLVREVKSVDRKLPDDEELLLRDYTVYMRQLAMYQELLQVRDRRESGTVRGELMLVDIASGTVQTLVSALPLSDWLEPVWQQLLAFLQARRYTLQQRKALQVQPPFAHWREGQEALRNQLFTDAGSARVMALQAPTGFGKTGILLEYALTGLRDGLWDRIVYLSGKNTGQLPVTRQLQRMVSAQGAVPFMHMRSQQELRTGLDLSEEELRDQTQRGNWQMAGLSPDALFQLWQSDPSAVEALARRYRLDPWRLAVLALPYADLWLGDYNYVFAPGSRHVFEERWGFDAGATLLIVDEAHNLPSRVAEHYSFSLHPRDLNTWALCTDSALLPQRLSRFIAELAGWIDSLPLDEPLDTMGCIELTGMVQAIADCWERCAGTVDDSWLPSAIQTGLWQLAGPVLSALRMEHPRIVYRSQAGGLRAVCLDAGSEIALTLSGFRQTLLVSATFPPAEVFAASVGMASGLHWLTGEAPWRREAYHCAVDVRVDTRFQYRERYLQTTAATVSQIAADGLCVAFFPSFSYARQVYEVLRAGDPYLRVALQPAQDPGSAQAREAFIGEAVQYAHALFLVMGSRYSEGIDHLGGKVHCALVVGPALPEVNPVQEARSARFSGLGRMEAFRQVYQIPGMLRIHQALGRLVRGPGQRTKVLFHCQRFAQPAYRELLEPVYQSGHILQHNNALRDWLQTP